MPYLLIHGKWLVKTCLHWTAKTTLSWELDSLPDTTSETIVMLMKIQLARFGKPETVLTDSGPQFQATLYATFTNK